VEIDLTVRAGEVAFDPGGLSMVRWDRAPPTYFRVPVLQSDPRARSDRPGRAPDLRVMS
jgi:hypothetical protein